MAAARAAARRQAILHSRGDRLAKLTSSARGEDPGGVYAHDDPPLPTLGSGLENFVGERSTLPTPPADPPKTSPKANKDSYPENREWSSAQQQELLRALMGSAGAGQPDLQTLPSIATDPSVEPSATAEDHISTLLASLSGGAANTIPNTAPPRPRTLTKKLLPVLHVVTMLAILVWFVIWKEPETFEASWLSSMVKSEGGELNKFGWRRWARLARGPPTTAGLFVPPVPAFFWAFTTLELALHSLRLFAEPDDYRPPMLLGLILPYLPPSLSQAILTSLKYLQMGSMVLDDLAILVFGIGLVIVVSNWAT